MFELTQTRLLVEDLARSRAFYTDVMGLCVGFESPIYVQLESPSGVSVGLFPRTAMAEAIGARRGEGAASSGDADRGVLVFRVADVDVAAAVLVERGAVQVGPPTDRREWGLRTAHFRDPDGHLIELIRRLE